MDLQPEQISAESTCPLFDVPEHEPAEAHAAVGFEHVELAEFHGGQRYEVLLCSRRERDVIGQHRSLAFDQRLIKGVGDHVEILRFEPRLEEVEIVEVGKLFAVQMPRGHLLVKDG